LLELDAVTFSYPKTQLIYTFDIQVSAGSVAAITGRSGCGKSTLLDLIAGFQQVNSGEILWQGRRLTDQPPSARPVTTVFQRNNLFEHRNAIDARKSPIVQFDEPFSALDQTTRDGMLSLVSNLANNHRCAVLMVTHSIADCEAIADKRYEMRDGALFEQ